MTEKPNYGPLTGIEVRDPCPHCGDHQLIPRTQMAEHLARLHPEVPTRSPYASGGELDASFAPAPAAAPPGPCGQHCTHQGEAEADPLREQYAAAISVEYLRRAEQAVVAPADEHIAAFADAAMVVRDTELQQLREMYSQQSAANAAYRLQIDELIRRNSEYADRGIANGRRATAAEAAIARVRAIPRLPHSSQQTGELGRAYTRGWESVINAIDNAVGRPQEQLTRAESHAAAAEQIRAAAGGLYATTGLRVLNALDQPQGQP